MGSQRSVVVECKVKRLWLKLVDCQWGSLDIQMCRWLEERLQERKGKESISLRQLSFLRYE